jgi:hypothetical protein
MENPRTAVCFFLIMIIAMIVGVVAGYVYFEIIAPR